MTENSENLHMSFLCPIDWHIFFPGGFDNFNANQDTLAYITETWCRLRSHVYQEMESFSSCCVMSSSNKTASKSFITKSELMQQPLWNQCVILNYLMLYLCHMFFVHVVLEQSMLFIFPLDVVLGTYH